MGHQHSRQVFSGPPSSAHRGRLTAVLGPTNTGKTHFAIERMLGHRSGMIGLPLRLLAREVRDDARKRIQHARGRCGGACAERSAHGHASGKSDRLAAGISV